MSSETDLVQKWIDEFGIHAVLDAERVDSPSPMSENWDLEKVWTCWDSYDQIGSFVSPGFVEKEDVEGELYVSAWFLGTHNFKKSSQDVQIMDRDTCDECDTEGCESCDEIGWVETDYLLETSFYPQDK